MSNLKPNKAKLKYHLINAELYTEKPTDLNITKAKAEIPLIVEIDIDFKEDGKDVINIEFMENNNLSVEMKQVFSQKIQFGLMQAGKRLVKSSNLAKIRIYND